MRIPIQDILICDDHPICQMGLEYCLRKSLQRPFDIRAVNSLKNLIEQLENKSPSLLFLDLQLPDAEALEGVVKVIERFPSIPIIVVTSCHDRRHLMRLRDWVANGTLKGLLWKTHDLERFQHALSCVALGSGQFVDPDILRALELPRPEGLTQREWEVLELIAKGLTNEAIAKLLHCSVETIKTHRSNLGHKTSSRNRSELTAWFLNRNGIRYHGTST